MSHFSKAIDEVRAAQTRKLAAEGRAPVLKRSRWLLLKRPENLTDAQSERVRRNLRTVRAWLLKEDFRALWEYVSPYWAGRFRPSSPRKRGPVVHPHDAFAARPDEEGRAHDALAPGVDLEPRIIHTLLKFRDSLTEMDSRFRGNDVISARHVTFTLTVIPAKLVPAKAGSGIHRLIQGILNPET